MRKGIFSAAEKHSAALEHTEEKPMPLPAEPGQASKVRQDEEKADAEVDLLAGKLKNSFKRGLKITFRAHRVHRQHYRTRAYFL